MTLPDDVTLRVLRLDAEDPVPLEALTDAERARLAAFGSARRRRAFALGRAAVRGLLGEVLGVPPRAVPLAVAADGALETASGLYVSLAHTEVGGATLAAAAVAPRPVGVDVEALRPRRPDLHRVLLAPEDLGLLDAFDDLDRAHITLWALKEAVLKAERTGLRCSPRRVRLALAGAGGTAHVDGRTARWHLRYAEHDGAVLAAAFAAPPFEPGVPPDALTTLPR